MAVRTEAALAVRTVRPAAVRTVVRLAVAIAVCPAGLGEGGLEVTETLEGPFAAVSSSFSQRKS